MIFFTDRDLGTTILPDILKAAGLKVERHVDHFTHDTPDAIWIPEVASRGWFVLTHDKRTRYSGIARDALMLAGAGVFVLVGHAPHRELGQNFVNTQAIVSAFIESHERPFIAKVYRPSPVSDVLAGRPGRVELWLWQGIWRGR